MTFRASLRSRSIACSLGALLIGLLWTNGALAQGPHRYLYVATPGIRNYLEYGGHGLLVFDVDDGHKFVKRIRTAGIDPKTGQPENVKGVAANARTGRIYVSTTRTVTCLDLRTEEILWEREYEGGCDRMAIAPDGSNLYVPSFEKDHWHVIDGTDGKVLAKIVPRSGAHNTVYGSDGSRAYLAGLRSPLLTIATTASHEATATVGPFSAPVRPFTVNGSQTLCFVNVNSLLGFEVGDLKTGEKLHRVEIQGFKQGPIKRHGCPSHGIGLTPDEKELWVVDAFNERVHIFDATIMPPKQVTSVKLRDEPGWVTFTLDGQYAYPSTGEVIDVRTRKIVAVLKDENGGPVQSEKMVEIDFEGSNPVRAGDQFGVGRVTAPR
ncbi:MAG: YncE family protein [Isosphaeraceae bacterium]